MKRIVTLKGPSKHGKSKTLCMLIEHLAQNGFDDLGVKVPNLIRGKEPNHTNDKIGIFCSDVGIIAVSSIGDNRMQIERAFTYIMLALSVLKKPLHTFVTATRTKGETIAYINELIKQSGGALSSVDAKRYWLRTDDAQLVEKKNKKMMIDVERLLGSVGAKC